MITAYTVQYLPATDTKQARFKVRCVGGAVRPVTVPYDFGAVNAGKTAVFDAFNVSTEDMEYVGTLSHNTVLYVINHPTVG